MFEQTCDRLGLSEAVGDQLEAHVATLGKWQPRLNLIGPNTWGHVWDRHVVDSLQCLDHLSAPGEGRGWADIGTGAGFPGVVLALATGIPVRLVESDQRKAAFLLAVKAA
ncbi:MAG: RsmG family class I SAM-dependent methyltransferase, partial [Pseudomonadota bacterium]|nr:RsmG family class I SAM-dependent methyltransferase [Pseudomonadota bacterium]